MMRVIVGTAPKLPQGKAGAIALEDLAGESLAPGALAALARAATLLGDTHAYRLEGALSGSDAEEYLALARELAQSPHLFVFLEEKLLKKPLELLAKAGAQVEVHAPPKKPEAYDVFAIANAFAARDRKKTWLLYTQALRRGAVPEAIAGMLAWKVRDQLAKTPVAKARERAELAALSRELVVLYHESHRGAGDLALLLERFILLV